MQCDEQERAVSPSNPPPIVGQVRGTEKLPLSQSQIEDLIRNQTPDNAIAAEIRLRRVKFSINRALVEHFTAIGAGPKTLQALRDQYPSHSPPRVLVAVADFDTSGEPKHGVTETILEELRDHAASYGDLQIIALGEPITAKQGRARARRLKRIMRRLYNFLNSKGYLRSPIIYR